MSPKFDADSMSMMDWYAIIASLEQSGDELAKETLGKLASNYQALVHGNSVYDEMGLPISLADAKRDLEEFVEKMTKAGGYLALA